LLLHDKIVFPPVLPRYWFNFGYNLLAATSLRNNGSESLFIGSRSFLAFPVHKETQQIGYDYQLSKARRKSSDQVLTFSLCCCHGKLAPSPVPTSLQLILLAPKRGKFCYHWNRGNTVILSGILTNTSHHSSVVPCLIDNRSKTVENNAIRKSERIGKMKTMPRIFP